LLLIAMTALVWSGTYVQPAEGPVAFRMDRMPLEVGAMGQLSAHLIDLVRANPGKTPEELRRVAQTFALAVALDPTNATTREMQSHYGKKALQPIDSQKLARSHRVLWKYIAWLETPEAGTNAQELANCFTDILAYSDYSHPRAEALRQAGEKGAWSSWVPDLAAYLPPPQKPEKLEDSPTKKPGSFLSAAQVRTLMWSRTADEKSWVRTVQPLAMEAQVFDPDEENPSKEFRLRFGDDSTAKLEDTLKSALVAHHRELPEKLRVTIRSEQLFESLQSGKRQSISAAGFVLASAAITGEEPDATILGVVTDKGEYILPSEFWYQMRDIQSANGNGRLILPKDAAEHLLGVLAMENPSFFFQYDVILAADTSELLRFSRKNLSEVDSSVLEAFEAIRTKKADSPTDLYIANNFIRPRLVDLSVRASWFASAKMLAIQASGNRPTRLSREILSHELMIALKPIADLVEAAPVRPNLSYIKRVETIYDTTRKAVDGLGRYVDSAERQLYEKARALTTQTRSFGRTCDKFKNYNYYQDGLDEFFIVAGVKDAHRALFQSYTDLKNELTPQSQP